MDNINPFSEFNKSNSDLSSITKDLKLKHGVPETGAATLPAPKMVDLGGFFDEKESKEIALFDNDIYESDVYSKVGDELLTKFPVYRKGIDNNEYYAERQTTGQKWNHGLQKLALKTGTAVIGGTVGTVTGLFNAIGEGSLSAMYSDDFNKMLDEYNEKLDFKLPNYYTEQERDNGFFESMGTHNFWANDVLGGLSFTLGMIVSEGIWAAATGGTSLLATGAKLGTLGRWSTKTLGANKALTALNKYKEPVKKLLNKGAKADLDAVRQATITNSNLVKGLNQARFIYTSAGYEAGVEARHYVKEMEDEWMMNFQEEYGRNPDAEEIAEFLREAEDGGNAVFGANLALVGSSNMAVFGKMLLGKSTRQAVDNSAVKKYLFGTGYEAVEGGGFKAVQASMKQKVAGKAYSILRAPVIEGVWEEGGQAVASNTMKDYVMDVLDSDATQENISLMDSVIKGLHETYGTKEGQKEIGIGMIIGLFGGGLATGGRFNEISQERKNAEQTVAYRNKFNPDKVLAAQITSERLKANNKILKANQRAEKARREGDMTGEFLSEQQAILASVERDSALQGTQQGIADFESYLATVKNTDLAEQLGVDTTVEGWESQVTDWKKNKVDDYRKISNRYKETERYVRALVGDTQFAGTAEINTTSEDIIKAISYNLTLGEQSDAFTKKLVEDIKLMIAGEVNFDSATTAMEVDQVLANSSREAVSKYMKQSQRVKNLQKVKAKVENQLVSAQYNKGQSTPEAHAKKLAQIQERLIKLDEQIAEVNLTKEAAFRALGIQNEVLTEADLDAQAERVQELQEKVEGYKSTNPELYASLEKLFDEYNRAKANTIGFNEMNRKLLDPQTRVSTLDGWLSGLLKKNKSLNDHTKEFFADQVKRYETNQVQGHVTSGQAQETAEAPTSTEAGDEMTPPVTETETKRSQTPLEILRQKISDIMGKNVYTTTYIGNDYDEAVKNKPSQEDFNRYEELLGKINTKYISKFNQLMNAPKGWFKDNKIDTGLTVEETEQLKELQNKLSNWKVLEGSMDSEDNSVADLMLLVEQLEAQVEKENTKTEISDNEYGTIKQAPDKEAKEGYETAEGVQSPDQALVSLIDVRGEAIYSFSHLDITSLERLFPDSNLEIVQGKTTKPVSQLSKSKLAKAAKKEGTEFILNTPDGVVNIKIGKRSRLNISKKSLDNSINNSNIVLVKYGSGNFMDVYEKLSNGEMIPLRGDFSYASTLKGEVIELVPEVVNSVTEGQILITRINKNDAYNKSLLEAYNRSKKTEEDLTTLMNDLHIYITDQKGQIIGSLRAAKDDLSDNAATKNLLELRRKAVDKILDENNTDDYFSLNESVPVRTVLIGSPNFVIGEDMKPVAIDFTDTALEQVEDVGYYEGSTLNLRNMDGEKVIRTFLPKTSAQKMPVVIIDVNGKKVAFPVTLKSTTVDKTARVQEILNTELRQTDKISRINEILIESGLKPANYITENQGVIEINQEKVLTDLSAIKDFPNLADWMQSSYKLENLKAEAQIGINLDNNPFNLSKVMLDLTKTKTVGQSFEMRGKFDNLEDRELQLHDRLMEHAVAIRKAKANYYIDDTQFTDILDEAGIHAFHGLDVWTDRGKHINLLRELSNVSRKPKEVIASHEAGFFDRLKADLAEFDTVVARKAEMRANIKDAKLKEQAENQKEKCPS